MSGIDSSFLNIISGNTETEIFINSNYENRVLEVFSDQKPNLFLTGLSVVSIKFDSECLQNMGTIYQILKYLLWEKINLMEVVSIYTELTLIVDKINAKKVFEILTERI